MNRSLFRFIKNLFSANPSGILSQGKAEDGLSQRDLSQMGSEADSACRRDTVDPESSRREDYPGRASASGFIGYPGNSAGALPGFLLRMAGSLYSHTGTLKLVYGVFMILFLIGIPLTEGQARQTPGLFQTASRAQIQEWTEKGHRYYYLKKYSQAAEWYRKAAEQGDKTAQTKLGYLYFEGLGVPKNWSEATRWFHKAAEQGVVIAQVLLGFMHYDGLGVPQDYRKASHWLELAALQGEALAQNRLGIMYENGFGVKQDYARAVFWYRQAAEQGNTESAYRLGVAYGSGKGVAEDQQQAFKWIQKAANSGHPKAQTYLGFMYLSGQGVGRDVDKAFYWLEKGTDQKISRIKSN